MKLGIFLEKFYKICPVNVNILRNYLKGSYWQMHSFILEICYIIIRNILKLL